MHISLVEQTVLAVLLNQKEATKKPFGNVVANPKTLVWIQYTFYEKELLRRFNTPNLRKWNFTCFPIRDLLKISFFYIFGSEC